MDLTSGSDLNLTAAGSFNLSGHLHATSGGNITLSGLTSATNDIQLQAVGAVAVNGALSAGSNFTAQANAVVINNNLTAQSMTFQTPTLTLANSGSLTSSHDIQANNATSIALDGTVNATNNLNLTASGGVEIGGSTQAANATIHSGTLTVNGSLSAATINLQLSTGLNPGLAGSLISAQNLSITVPTAFTFNTTNAATTEFAPNVTSLTLNAASIALDPVNATNNLNLTASGDVQVNGATQANNATIHSGTLTVNGSLSATTVNLQLSTGLNPGGAGSLISAQNLSITVPTAFTFNATNSSITRFDLTNLSSLTINAQSIAFDSDLNLAGPAGDLTATSGNIDATGHQLSGFDQIRLTNGNLLASNVSANKVVINQSGGITVANNLSLTQSLSAPGAVSVGGLLSAQTVNAGSVSANALHVNNLTSSGALFLTSSDLAPFSGTNLNLSAGSISLASDIVLSGVTAELTATSSDINAAGLQLSGFDQISATGNLTATSVSANKFTIGGTLAAGTVNAVNAGNITTNALHADNVTANNSITINTSDLAPFSTSTISINAPNISLPAGANLNGQNGTPLSTPGNANYLSINTSSHDFSLGSSVSLNGGDGDPTVSDGGGNGGQLSITANNVTVNAPISATSGQNSNNTLTGGNGGTVNIAAQKTVTLNNKIEVSSNDGNRRLSARGGNINVASTATSGTAISVSSSAQLLALLNAAAPGSGGTIKFTSAGGAINMNGTAQADRGTIDIRNTGSNGTVALNNAVMAADTIKVGALGTNGTLNVGGGTISADSLIKLYAGGSNGTIDFTNNVTLSGTSAKTIAANTVTINNGKVVTILGPAAANVFTNNPNYFGFGGNGSTTGTFAGKGAVTAALSAAPVF